MATITHDTPDWYGFDEYGASVHDVLGTRCDPCTHHLLTGGDYHYCCHSNLTRALAAARNLPLAQAEGHVHDVANLFMCTGYSRDTNQYFMKASPARSGDFIEFFAEIDLLAALSACPGGNCGAGHFSDIATCHPLRVEILAPAGRGTGGLAAGARQRVRRRPRHRLTLCSRDLRVPGDCSMTRVARAVRATAQNDDICIGSSPILYARRPVARPWPFYAHNPESAG